MPIRSKLLTAASLSAFALAGLPLTTTAGAAELGTVDTAGVGSCGTNALIWGTSGSLKAPTDGVLTKLRTAAGAGDSAGSGAIVVVRPDGGGVKAVAVEPVTIAGTGVVELTGKRIPVKAGDALALWIGADGWDCGVAPGPDGIAVAPAAAQPAVDGAFAPGGSGTAKIAVGATLEPDADLDGYGDTSQDSCATDASVHEGPCQTDLATAVAASAASVEVGDVTTADVTVLNAGTGKATAAKLAATVPSGLQLLSVNPRSCTFGGALGCELGDLLGGKDQVLTFTLKGREAGDHVLSAKASFAGTDTVPANDTGAVTIKVTEKAPASAASAPAKTCTVPTLKGLRTPFAKRLLEAAGCKLGKRTSKRVKRGTSGVVVSQGTQARRVVPAGTAVKVTVAKRTRR